MSRLERQPTLEKRELLVLTSEAHNPASRSLEYRGVDVHICTKAWWICFGGREGYASIVIIFIFMARSVCVCVVMDIVEGERKL